MPTKTSPPRGFAQGMLPAPSRSRGPAGSTLRARRPPATSSPRCSARQTPLTGGKRRVRPRPARGELGAPARGLPAKALPAGQGPRQPLEACAAAGAPRAGTAPSPPPSEPRQPPPSAARKTERAETSGRASAEKAHVSPRPRRGGGAAGQPAPPHRPDPHPGAKPPRRPLGVTAPGAAILRAAARMTCCAPCVPPLGGGDGTAPRARRLRTAPRGGRAGAACSAPRRRQRRPETKRPANEWDGPARPFLLTLSGPAGRRRRPPASSAAAAREVSGPVPAPGGGRPGRSGSPSPGPRRPPPTPATGFCLGGTGACAARAPRPGPGRRPVPPGSARRTAPPGRGGGVWRRGGAGSRGLGPRCGLYCLRGLGRGPGGRGSPVPGGSVLARTARRAPPPPARGGVPAEPLAAPRARLALCRARAGPGRREPPGLRSLSHLGGRGSRARGRER